MNVRLINLQIAKAPLDCVLKKVSAANFAMKRTIGLSSDEKLTLSNFPVVELLSNYNVPFVKPYKAEPPYSSARLYHKLKKGIMDTDELDSILRGLSNDERYLGSLPFEWFSGVDKEQIPSKTNEIYDAFSQFASSSYTTRGIRPRRFLRPMFNLENRLSEVLNKDVIVDYYNEGYYGKVFRVSLDDKDYALKVFHSNLSSLCNRDMHGKTKEIANQIAYGCTKPSKRSRFYFGKIAGTFDKDGFILSEFADKKGSYSLNLLSVFDFHRFMLIDEKPENYAGKKLVDFGAIKTRYKTKKEAQMAREMLPLIKREDVEGVRGLIEKYDNDKDFNSFVQRSLRADVDYIALYYNLPFSSKTKKQAVEAFSPKRIEIFNLLGITPKCVLKKKL